MQINGIGTTYLNLQRDELSGTAIVEEWFTFVFLPLLPLGKFLIKPAANGGFHKVQELNWTNNQIALAYLRYWLGDGFFIFGALIIKDISAELFNFSDALNELGTKLALGWFVFFAISLVAKGQWRWWKFGKLSSLPNDELTH